MVANVLWQGLLNALGSVLAWIYDIIPNYGIAIIVLTLAIRLLLLPLGIKQIKSMQHMQALQPKLKELQKKYKNNRQKQQEEQMKLCKEAGVNPLGGCLPMLLTLPFLFAMYAVIRPPTVTPSRRSWCHILRAPYTPRPFSRSENVASMTCASAASESARDDRGRVRAAR